MLSKVIFLNKICRNFVKKKTRKNTNLRMFNYEPTLKILRNGYFILHIHTCCINKHKNNNNKKKWRKNGTMAEQLNIEKDENL